MSGDFLVFFLCCSAWLVLPCINVQYCSPKRGEWMGITTIYFSFSLFLIVFSMNIVFNVDVNFSTNERRISISIKEGRCPIFICLQREGHSSMCSEFFSMKVNKSCPSKQNCYCSVLCCADENSFSLSRRALSAVAWLYVCVLMVFVSG